MMKGIPRGKYTKEFRQEAVKLVIEEKLSWGKAGRRLNLAPSIIDKSYRLLTKIEMEMARVKKENAELKMERDILKKAAAYFARESLSGTRS